MNEHRTLEARLTAGELDGTLVRLYGAPRLEAVRARCAGVLDLSLIHISEPTRH